MKKTEAAKIARDLALIRRPLNNLAKEFIGVLLHFLFIYCLKRHSCNRVIERVVFVHHAAAV